MIFRVNGAAIFARGANMIPMEELEGRLDADAHRYLVQSAAHANFNMLRVWGGGIIVPDALASFSLPCPFPILSHFN